MAKKRILHPRRDAYLTIHHLIPRCRKLRGWTRPKNKLKLWSDSHVMWHRIFYIDTLDEILSHWDKYEKHWGTREWSLLFKGKTNVEVKKLLQRVRKMKQHLK